MFNGMRKRYTK
uniref:Uncharacterized protein n=1 Tax=Arundo donax TaxID=35708 RepID=A0A0A9C8S6_ARUDO